MKTIIKIICAWCGKDMGEKDGEGVAGISHSICKKCLDEWLAGEGRYNKKKPTPNK